MSSSLCLSKWKLCVCYSFLLWAVVDPIGTPPPYSTAHLHVHLWLCRQFPEAWELLTPSTYTSFPPLPEVFFGTIFFRNSLSTWWYSPKVYREGTNAFGRNPQLMGMRVARLNKAASIPSGGTIQRCASSFKFPGSLHWDWNPGACKAQPTQSYSFSWLFSFPELLPSLSYLCFQGLFHK